MFDAEMPLIGTVHLSGDTMNVGASFTTASNGGDCSIWATSGV